MQSFYAPKVWKLLPILENNQNDYESYLFNLIVELSGEDKLSDRESYVLKKLKDKSFVVKKAKTASFLQEFFYRNKLLYSISKVDNKIHIDPVLRYKKLDIGFLIPVEDVIYNYKSSTLLDIITYD